jgi:hypothetical protein
MKREAVGNGILHTPSIPIYKPKKTHFFVAQNNFYLFQELLLLIPVNLNANCI